MKLYIMIFLICLSVAALADSPKELTLKIRVAAKAAGIDPDLAVAIATVESGLNPNAVGKLGEIGLFQLRGEFHKVSPGNANENILVGVDYLKDLQSKFESRHGDGWIVMFNFGPNRPPKHPKKTVYYKRVMREVGKIRVQRYLVAY